MMKTNSSQKQMLTYDNLLAKYLPIIHRAARSLICQQKNECLESLLWAGTQGLKTAFNQLPPEQIYTEQDDVLWMIHASMVKSFRVNNNFYV